MRFATLAAAALMVVAAAARPVRAEEQAIALKPGPGEDAALINCNACHSLDYIRMNAPFMTRKMWEAEVAKMINVFGASILPDDAALITDYLVRNYGKPD